MKIHSIVIGVDMIPNHIKNSERVTYDGLRVYVLIYNGTPIYVGSTQQLFQRLYLHKKYVQFDKVMIFNFYDQNVFEELCKMEQFYIDKLNPPLNRKLTWFERVCCTPEKPINYKDIILLYNKRDFKSAR